MESGSVIPCLASTVLYRPVWYCHLPDHTILWEAWPSYFNGYSVVPLSQSSSWDSLPRTLEGRHPWTVNYRTVE